MAIRLAASAARPTGPPDVRRWARDSARTAAARVEPVACQQQQKRTGMQEYFSIGCMCTSVAADIK